GDATLYKRDLQFIHPEVQILETERNDSEPPSPEPPGLIPVYPLTEGLSQRLLRRVITGTLQSLEEIPETLPENLRRRGKFPTLIESLASVHRPPPDSNINDLNLYRSPGHQRLIFEEFFYVTLGMALKKRGIQEEKGISFQTEGVLVRNFLKNLPFDFTAAQKRVANEIGRDMAASRPMNRLVQGDVGSGKTVLSLLAAVIAIQNGTQAALMAPTEILAEQHFLTARQFFEKLGIPIALLTSARLKTEREETLKKVAKGEIPFVVGTHAVLEEDIRFSKLGLAIVDEQHRFGVLQRAALKKKGIVPDVLVMTATPIPRTLAMTVYGDLDVSILDELPPGRQPIETLVVAEKSRSKVYALIRQALERKEQVYVVYPLVEESEKMDLKDATGMAEILKEEFSNARIGLLHGRLSSEEKEETMRSFKEKRMDILVSTTVIEVGVDVPNATLMVVEHAERFGLAQLHQLRGRIGRGTKKSHCLLLVGGPQSEESSQRLSVMAKTQDGFKIAEADLEIRGPGEFLGTRQAGLPDFHIANIVRDAPFVALAKEEAARLVAEDPFLKKSEHAILKKNLLERWQGKLELAGVA
ncbi:MAG: ATP-dependent DNA helicase RecG, partial [bacterium]|nr:ATP-dependent DNA helicase RecG [bacterium]